MTYRADIDGLRSLAILPVLFFHAGIAGFSGGYIGVDIFFVISGFLISRIIRDELANGQFRLGHFYERRVRRIVPALAVTLLATAIAAGLFLLPADLLAFSRGLLAAIFSVSNIYFFRTTSYFTADSTAQPLLHTWSLGVEEQFYLLLPVFMLLVWRLRPTGLGWAIWVLVLLSLALSVVGMRVAPGFTFFMLPTRAWELLAGAVVSLGLVPAIHSQKLRTILSLAGLGLILAPVFLYSSATPFPGLAALPPVLGTCLLLHTAPGTIVARLLQVRPLVVIGLISYSLYLWHWPVLMLYQYRTGAPLDGWTGPALLVLSFILAMLTWCWIEQPFRRAHIIGARTIWSGAAAALAMVSFAGLVGIMGNGLPQRFSPEALRLANSAQDYSAERQRCFALPDGMPALDRNCLLAGAGKADIAVWSDSHGVELADTLAERGMNLQLFASSNCPPALGFAPVARPLCMSQNAAILSHIQASDIGTIILAARFANDDYPDAGALFDGVEAAIGALIENEKTVILIGAMPEPGFAVPRRLALAANDGSALETLAIPKPAAERARAIDNRLADIAARTGAIVFAPSEQLCNPDCTLYEQGQSLYFDDNHLSMAGARLLAPALTSLLIGAADQ